MLYRNPYRPNTCFPLHNSLTTTNKKSPTLAKELTAVILDESQVRELGTHVTHNSVQRASPRPELTGQLLLEGCLTWSQPRRWVAGMQGRGRCLHGRHDKDEPVKERRQAV
jgi:hypothetical protein